MTRVSDEDTTARELDAVLAAASSAYERLVDTSGEVRARALRRVADALDDAVGDLVPLANDETGLPVEPRLVGELGRTTFQLRLLAEAVADGGYLEVALDSPDPHWPAGGRPDLRRMLRPIGPVVVFAASNFPFAFSVAGGDTAAALAVGCPVVLKANPGHPRLSAATASLVSEALGEVGLPEGTFALVTGEEAGRAAVLDPRVMAGAFTGSNTAGRALFDLACSRPDPIPFYAEMGSVNPVLVTEAAASSRAGEIADGYLASFTLGAGQFCTKPGLLFLPAAAGPAVEERLVAALAERPTARLLNDRVADGHARTLSTLAGHPATRLLAAGTDSAAGPAPTLLAVSAADFLAHRSELAVECFGPTSIVVTYSGEDELVACARTFTGELTATVHGEGEDPVAAVLLAELSGRAGRVLWNGWPTGVAVTYAMHHGGPYPATTSAAHTSVGTASLRRFLRPVTYQNVPQHLLPTVLRDGNPLGVPRRVDGVLTPVD
ncbi:aldehyde dehydrogenase (NADP(+)) [Actinophytocola xanthii]|uniref:Aldehyde dehydrogenase (NADP(+)) n=1 Tax=Actinophytocola xanthii TaxID=1912961 RepID=A0A1Q8CYJ9_9PSEU|nr:aldehyde dehydrogenase (NADP(+)) [Actinophytocola xanthii]OLF19428.1 aldehyde dehydrogenase (NADP(+)) [Actinophytocola xanthii]